MDLWLSFCASLRNFTLTTRNFNLSSGDVRPPIRIAILDAGTALHVRSILQPRAGLLHIQVDNLRENKGIWLSERSIHRLKSL